VHKYTINAITISELGSHSQKTIVKTIALFRVSFENLTL